MLRVVSPWVLLLKKGQTCLLCSLISERKPGYQGLRLPTPALPFLGTTPLAQARLLNVLNHF